MRRDVSGATASNTWADPATSVAAEALIKDVEDDSDMDSAMVNGEAARAEVVVGRRCEAMVMAGGKNAVGLLR